MGKGVTSLTPRSLFAFIADRETNQQDLETSGFNARREFEPAGLKSAPGCGGSRLVSFCDPLQAAELPPEGRP